MVGSLITGVEQGRIKRQLTDRLTPFTKTLGFITDQFNFEATGITRGQVDILITRDGVFITLTHQPSRYDAAIRTADFNP